MHNFCRGYDKIHEILISLKTKTDITDILEIGCYAGMFVESLREMGYNASGIDKNPLILRSRGMKEGYLHYQDALDLDGYSDGLYDLIFTNRVLSREALIGELIDEYSSTVIEFISNGEKNKETFRKEVDSISRVRNRNILQAAYKRIKPGKYFVAVESDAEQLCFTEQEARALGYFIEQYDPSKAILKKPN